MLEKESKNIFELKAGVGVLDIIELKRLTVFPNANGDNPRRPDLMFLCPQ